VKERLARFISQRKMRREELIATPMTLTGGRGRISGTQADAKERQLVPEAASITCLQMSSIIPPLRSEVVVRGVIAWKDEMPGEICVTKSTGCELRRIISPGCRETKREHQEDNDQPSHSLRTASAVRIRAATRAG
jgi:hypothetical protein